MDRAGVGELQLRRLLLRQADQDAVGLDGEHLRVRVVLEQPLYVPQGAFEVVPPLDLATALRAATVGSAFANYAEANRGTLTPGKYADLVVLSRDLFEVADPLEILDTTVTHTVVGGRVVHRAAD